MNLLKSSSWQRLLVVSVAIALGQLAVTAQTPEGLEPVPVPDLEVLEGVVAKQLGEMRELLLSRVDAAGLGPQEKSEAFGELGRIYHAYGIESPAEACYANASRLAPRDFRWPYLLADLHAKAGRLEPSRESFERALSIRPDYVAGLVRLGNVYVELNRPDDAETILTSALRIDSSSVAATAALGRVALSRKRYAEAIALLEKALAAVPDANRLHYPLGLAYRGLGDLDRAREHMGRAGVVGIRQEDALIDALPVLTRGETVHVLRGRTAYRAGRFGEAAEEFRKAVEANPKSSGARVNLGSALVRLRDTDGATAQFREALKLSPDDATVHFNLGSLLAHRGQFQEGSEHLRQSIRLNPGDGEAHVELADSLRGQGLIEDAWRHYREATGLTPMNEAAWLGEAEMLVQGGLYRQALDRLENARALIPTGGLIAHAMARLLAGCPDLTVRDGARALDLALLVFKARNSVGHAETVAMSLAEVGRCDEAAEWQTRAIAAAEAGTATPPELLERLRRAAPAYESGPPCRYPGQSPESTER